MTIDENLKQLLLQFFARVVRRESTHLNSTAQRLFVEPFTVERAQKVAKDDELSERLESFVSRFSRLQDTLGDKLIPLLLGALGEQQATAMDNLDRGRGSGGCLESMSGRRSGGCAIRWCTIILRT